nr:hypothetical protein [Tanacetum cinerariifolium]
MSPPFSLPFTRHKRKSKLGFVVFLDQSLESSLFKVHSKNLYMPSIPDLSFTSLDEFVNKLVVENCKAMSNEEEPKVVWKNDDAPIIEEWVLDNEEEDAS